MADLGISEFTFGYAFIHEQINILWKDISSIPIFPSLIEEKKVGWDVKLPLKGKALYYQIKTSELLKNANSKYIKDGTYSGPYYRIKLHKMFNNKQHRMLWKLSQTEKDTYYVAPECANIHTFNKAFLDGKVTDYSRLIPLTKCHNYDSNDSNQHFITYEGGNKTFHQHSKKSESRESILGKNLRDLYRDRQQDFKPINSEFSDKIISNVLELSEYYEESRFFNNESFNKLLGKADTTYQKLSLSASILWAFYGIFMVIIGDESR